MPCPTPSTSTPSRASSTDGLHTCLTIAKRALIPETPSKIPPWVPLVSCAPNRHRFWNTGAGCNIPKGTLTPTVADFAGVYGGEAP